ncbi:HEAT repeat domain-containing protein [Cohnella candidum]|uniref:HEAT repeat domain-containing protein n=1 Tax=Cohnella candidum TaxID=2674991 RepID=A0A3G3JWS7_9BACL|nr:HEAT repeat domain-containing protein [Cohnella candidum]AYQ72665.1 HEAT repeat domain-containing protein [Cohnella candidum]
MNLTVALLLRAVLFLAALLLLTFGYLVVRKVFENFKAKRIAEMKETYMQPVYGYIRTGNESRMVHFNGGRWKEEAIEEILLQCSRLFRDEETGDRIREYAELHLMRRYAKRLSSRLWSHRVNTLHRLERFDLKSSAPVLTDMYLLPRTTMQEKYAILKLLACWGVEGTVDLLGRLDGKLPDFEQRLILSRMSDRLFRQTVLRLGELPVSWRYTAIDVIGLFRRTEYGPELDGFADSADGETRVRALKALSQFDVIRPKKEYLIHAAAESWQERMMAAKLFGAIRNRQFEDVLVGLMGDPVWFVRSQAAQSLASYPQGAEVLRETAASSDDRFAREMALEWLERGGDRG